MYSDKETDIDALGFEPYVDSLSELISEKGITPFTIGVFGTWGTGKTSLMLMLQKKLDSTENIRTVSFNAWKFEEREQIWTALIQTILDQLELSKKQKVKEKIQELRDSIEWIQIFEFLSKSVVSGLPDFNFLRKTLGSRKDIKSIADFEEKFKELVNICEIRRLVVFVDDLDRCRMDATLDILEAMKLLLNSEKCVYILGLDYKRTCDAISERFAKDSQETAESYLEKIIQLPFKIPRRTEEDMKLYLRYLFALKYLDEKNIRKFAGDIRGISENIEEEFPKLLHNYVDSFPMDEYKTLTEYDLLIIKENDFNPRKLKRFLNTYELRRSLSRILELDLINEYIIKLLLLQIKFADFYRDLEGYPDLIKDVMELISLSEEKIKEKLLQSELLEKHYSSTELIRFLKEAHLEDLDLRPYLRIAETTRMGAIVIGEKEETILRDLMSGDHTRLKQGVSNFGKLPPKEQERIVCDLLKKTEHRKIEVRRRSEQALEKMGLARLIPEDLIGDVVRKLIEKAEDKSVRIRKDILRVIGEMKEVIPEDLMEDVVDKLIEKTDDASDGVKKDALRTIGEMKEVIPEDLMEDVVDTLIEKTDAKGESVKKDALRTIGEMKEVIPEDLMEEVVDKLIEKTDDASDGVKENAFKTIGEMKEVIPEDLMEDVVDKLIERVRAESYFVTEKALRILENWRDYVPEKLKRKIDRNI